MLGLAACAVGASCGWGAIAVGDALLMLQYSTYSVISPEGCASILWKSADNASEAAESMAITAARLKTLGLIDRIVNEPLGGAHRDQRSTRDRLVAAFLSTQIGDRFFGRVVSINDAGAYVALKGMGADGADEMELLSVAAPYEAKVNPQIMASVLGMFGEAELSIDLERDKKKTGNPMVFRGEKAGTLAVVMTMIEA